ncbi:MAG: cytochrome d ubiquinol oxidase subunit II [Ktedonobacteraceae bacterium]
MQTIWFILVAFMLSMYVLLDGFDLGAGIIHLVAARTNEERRLILRAIGPVWDGNEVWLIAAAGTLFFAFPILYATSFSGFYLPLMMVLWLLIVRGIAIEMRSHFPHALWGAFWDAAFFLGSMLLALFFGAALGNVIRGVPLDATGNFFEPLWTDFSPFSAHPGILDWYTVLIGLMALATLTLHGANYIIVKTQGPLYERTGQLATVAWWATLVLTILSSLATYIVQPHIRAGFVARPWGVIFPLLALAGLVGTRYWNSKRQDLLAFCASGAFILGLLISTAFGLYPTVLPAVNPAYSLTISNTSASPYSLSVGLLWWTIGILLAVIYFVFTYRLFRGKVSMSDLHEH